MLNWTTPILQALERRASPCRVFFRDDDAGWESARLFALLTCFEHHTVPVDLALIPAALTPSLEQALLRRIATGERRIGVHQHGFAHLNHEPCGRKCEFGEGRSRREQRFSIQAGQALIRAAFGTLGDGIFTPPWNRCNEDTASVLVDLGFAALSRDSSAAPFGRRDLQEIPIAIDWCKLRPPGTSAAALGERVAARLASADSCGIMLHHAVMEPADLALLDTMLPLLRDHPAVNCVSMRTLLGQSLPDTPNALSDTPASLVGGEL